MKMKKLTMGAIVEEVVAAAAALITTHFI